MRCFDVLPAGTPARRTNRVFRPFGLACTILLLQATATFAEYTRSSAIACKSLATYRGLEYEKFAGLYQSMVAKRECTSFKSGIPVRVVERRATYVRFELLDGSAETWWGSKTAVVRRKQPATQTVILSGPDDAGGLCSMLSQETRTYARPAIDLARGVSGVHNKASDAYARAIENHDFELVVHDVAGRCVAELDVADQELLGCHIDTRKFYNCRTGRKGRLEESDCYQELCRTKAPVTRPDPSAEMRGTLQAGSGQRTRDESLKTRELAATRAAVDRYASANFGKRRAPASEKSCSNLSDRVKADQILARNLAGAVQRVFERGEYAAIREFDGPTARAYENNILRDEFSLKVQFEDGDCRAIYLPRSDLNLPALACVLRAGEAQRCLEMHRGGGSQPNIPLAFCLMDVCVQ